MTQKAQRQANIAYSIRANSCKKILIGKTNWKIVALLAILHGINTITHLEADIEELKKKQKTVYAGRYQAHLDMQKIAS